MKQAVVLVHGIGEQRPMEALRKFATAVLPPAPAGKEQYWSKPDRLTDLLELRVLSANQGRNRTDFYEMYWAHHVADTKFSHLVFWASDLIARDRKNVPAALMPLWLTARTLVIAFVALVLSGSLTFAGVEAKGITAASLMVTVASFVAQVFLLQYVGDAARYLSPRPDNVKVRQAVRAEGVTLVRELHARGYDRIVIVGHSLGSIIGYDIITKLWHEMHGTLAAFETQDPALLARHAQGYRLQPCVSEYLYKCGEELGKLDTVASHDSFRWMQRQGFLEQRILGNPWRITDFVTLGSPLAHAGMLMAASLDDFEKRKQQRELPTCPPVAEDGRYAYARRPGVAFGKGTYSPLVLHHAAAFAVTAWTNLYFPVRAGVFGDVIGGPLRGVFGLGIRDVPIDDGDLALPTSHTRYWSPSQTPTKEGALSAVGALRDALRLGALRDFQVAKYKLARRTKGKGQDETAGISADAPSSATEAPLAS